MSFPFQLKIRLLCYSLSFRGKHSTVVFQKNSFRMYLMYYMSEEGNRVYTLAKTDPAGNPTFSAHPARWSYRQMKLHTVLQQYSYIMKPCSSL